MELKKNPDKDLEKNKLTFLLTGLVLTLALVYGAFEMSFSSGAVDTMAMTDVVIEDEIIPVTRQDVPPPPPPPPAAPAEILEVVENDETIEDEVLVEDMETKEDQTVQIIEVPEEEEEEQQPFVIVEKMPEFPGGQAALMKFIGSNTRYPNVARENGIQGRVFIRFVVKKDGSVDQVTVLRPVDPLLDKEAIRVVTAMPKWTPGEQRGKKVPVWYTVPINFQLQ